METSRETAFLTYQGLIHSLEDLNRRYKNSIIEIFHKPTSLDAKYGYHYAVFMPSSIEPHQVKGYVFEDGKWEKRDYGAGDLHISREYPRNGLVQIGSFVFLLSRNPRRQWRRGANEQTIEHSCVYKDPDKKGQLGQDIVFASAFNQRYLSPSDFKEHLKSGKTTTPKVVTPKLWCVSRDDYLVSLYFEDIFIGMCDKNLKFIPCKESLTLAEEIVNEYGLQPI